MQRFVMYVTGMYKSYLELVLRYKYLILFTYHLQTLYLREKGSVVIYRSQQVWNSVVQTLMWRK
jgi:hypothetical protein